MRKIVSGIYKIECLVNNKMYIGSSCNIYTRWSNHKSALKRIDHHSIRLQNAWNKYGKENFKFTIIEETNNLIDREQYWLDFYKSYKIGIGYNISITALPTEDENFYLKSIELNSKEWVITHPDGTEVEVKNIHEYCRFLNLGLDPSCLIKVARGKRNQHKGFKCRPKGMTLDDWEKTKVRHWKGCRGWNGKWIITFPDGHEEIVNALTTFCKKYNLSEGALGGLAVGRGRHHKGFRCRKMDGKEFLMKYPYKYLIVYPDYSTIVIDSLSKFCKENNLSTKSMRESCRLGHKHNKYKCFKLVGPNYEIPDFSDKIRHKYIITHPDGTEERVVSIRNFCIIKCINPSGFYSICNTDNEYKGYRCKKI